MKTKIKVRTFAPSIDKYVPHVGMTVKIHNQEATIIRVHPLGTIDVQRADGRCFRISGLPIT